jgi:predicted NAD/FAD-binding protein
VEWAGSNLATVSSGKSAICCDVSSGPCLSDILRFNRESVSWLASHPGNKRSLRDFLRGRALLKRHFTEWYLLPMAAAIWSCPTGQMLDTPLATFVRFCQNHGLLQVFDRPMWRTVKGGGREYVSKIAAQLDDIRLACPVRAVTREAGDPARDACRRLEAF